MSLSLQLMGVDEIAACIPDGCRLAMPVDYAGVSMAVIKPLVKIRPQHLQLIGVPTGGLAFDILIGAGLVQSVETSAVSLGEAGGAPCFMRAIARGQIEIKDSTCPAVHAGLMAAQKGAPFIPLRGLIGSDVLKMRSDWKMIQNPLSEQQDPIVLIPALQPDVSVFHAPMADCEGNVWIGRRRELAAMAYASKQTFVTVERVVQERFLDDEQTAAGVLPALYINAVAVAPRGAQPYGLWGEYAPDTAALLQYARMARSEKDFEQWLEKEFLCT